MQTLHDNVIRTLINLAEDGSPAERIAALAEARFWIADKREHGDFELAPENQLMAAHAALHRAQRNLSMVAQDELADVRHARGDCGTKRIERAQWALDSLKPLPLKPGDLVTEVKTDIAGESQEITVARADERTLGELVYRALSATDQHTAAIKSGHQKSIWISGNRVESTRATLAEALGKAA